MEKIKKSIDTSPYFKNSPEEKKKALSEFVKYIRELQENNYVHGHGVEREEDARNIEQHGLYTAWNTLQGFSYPLRTHEQLLAEQIVGWDYQARQYVVLIAVPKHEDYYASDAADETRNAWENNQRSAEFAKQHVFESADRPDGVQVPHNADKRISPSKIIGYWDDKEGKLHINPVWQGIRPAEKS